jgi:hypothetical protein
VVKLNEQQKEGTMKNYFKSLVAAVEFIIILVVIYTTCGSDLWAKEKSKTLEKQIQGTWELVSIYVDKDGEKIDAFGANPRGSMILAQNGRFSIIIMKASLPKFAANNRIKGTAEENQAVIQGSVAYFGSYKIESEKEHMVSLHIEGGTFPNWDGEEQKRIMNVAGDEIKVTNPTAAIGGASDLVWKRIK